LGAVEVLEGSPHHSLEATIMARIRRPTAGPGRPKKWSEELVDLFLRVPKSYKERFDAERGPMSRTEYFVFVMDHTHKDIKEMGRRIAELEQKVALLEKELEQKNKIIVQKDKIIERQNRIIEEKDSKIIKLEEKVRNLEAQIEALKQGRSVRTYEEGKLLRALAEHAREGISWADLCAEVLDLRDEKKMRHLMKLAFNVKKADRDTYERVFYPKRTSPEFQKWVLVRPNRDGPVLLIDYELWPRDVYEVAEASKKAKAEAKANMVKRLKTGKAAERFIEMTFESIYRNYMEFIKARQGEKAKEYLEEKVPAILVEKVFPEIAPEEVRKAVLAVIQRHEEDWNEAFVSNLRRVVLKKAIPRPVEVKADV